MVGSHLEMWAVLQWPTCCCNGKPEVDLDVEFTNSTVITAEADLMVKAEAFWLMAVSGALSDK